MRKLRGFYTVKHVLFSLLLILATASSLTLLNPQSTQAQSPSLLETVRCLVRTVFRTDCTPVAPTTPVTPTAPGGSSSPQNGGSQGNSSSIPPVSSGTSGQGSGQSSGGGALQQSGGSIEPIGSEIIPPTKIVTERQNANSGVLEEQAGQTSDTSRYYAYFNKYSPYAQTSSVPASSGAVVETSSEGWKLYGIAWYWWITALGLLATIAAMIKKMVIRRRLAAIDSA